MTFDWGADRRPHHEEEAVVYELHVRGFTQHASSGVSARARGTFAGVIEKIPYLREFGVNVVELMPVFQFDPQARDSELNAYMLGDPVAERVGMSASFALDDLDRAASGSRSVWRPSCITPRAPRSRPAPRPTRLDAR